MNARRLDFWRVVSLIAILVAIPVAGGSAATPADGRPQRGRERFVRSWAADDEQSPKGDGLGPLYNATSCVACHSQGGVGGGGRRGVNVQLLTFTGAHDTAALANRPALQASLERIHPGFVSRGAIVSTIVLHRHSTEPRYSEWRESFLRVNAADNQPRNPFLWLISLGPLAATVPPQPQHVTRLAVDGLSLQLSERNTPALFGASLINSVSEKVLRTVAHQQAERLQGITGRVPRSIDGKVGRFGWRGQVSTLKDFVQNACAVELGLQLRDRSQAVSPLAPHEASAIFPLSPIRHALSSVPDKKRAAQPHIDMEATQMEELLAFVSSLPAPQQVKSKPAADKRNDALLLSQLASEGVFTSIGCADCHQRRLGKIDGLYSDLLLHDMGPGLSDPSPAIDKGDSSVRSVGYGGGSFFPQTQPSHKLAERQQEWRTPPLWGVATSAPYLHDGRAETLEEAILAHGGEARRATQKFKELPEQERDEVIAFLKTLTVP
jgi:CxxC motif-containing protein (DUF1111 family)